MRVLTIYIIMISIFAAGVLYVGNKLYLSTNHWKNKFRFEKNFMDKEQCRDNVNGKLDIVNLGSNPALFGFMYECVEGQNWATGSQGLSMDYEVLKCYYEHIKTGGIVLIPIMPFTSISQYIETKKDYRSDNYFIKFAKILNQTQVLQLPKGSKLKKMIHYPLFYNPKLLKYLLVDVNEDRGLEYCEQTCSKWELHQDAAHWIAGWMKEFDVSDMPGFYDGRFEPYVKEGKEIINSIIGFCLEHNLKPVLITVPMSDYLALKFDERFRNKMIYEFVNNLNISGVQFMDYMFDKRFSDSSLYNGSFFLNLKGRKLFSSQVIHDLGLDNSF